MKARAEKAVRTPHTITSSVHLKRACSWQGLNGAKEKTQERIILRLKINFLRTCLNLVPTCQTKQKKESQRTQNKIHKVILLLLARALFKGKV